jgi:hypothetical protein
MTVRRSRLSDAEVVYFMVLGCVKMFESAQEKSTRWLCGGDCLGQRYLVVDRTDVANLRVTAGVVVEVDVALDADAQLLHVGEDMSVEVLVFEDRPEALGTGVVVARAGRPYGANDLQLLAELHHPVIGLTAAIGVKDRAGARERSCPSGVAQGLKDDLTTHVVGQAPAEHSAGVRVTDRAQVGLARTDGHVGDIARPHEIELTLVEATLHQILGAGGGRIGLRRDLEQPGTDALQTKGPHARRHRVVADQVATLVEVLGDPWGAVGAVRGVVEVQDLRIDLTLALSHGRRSAVRHL